MVWDDTGSKGLAGGADDTHTLIRSEQASKQIGIRKREEGNRKLKRRVRVWC